MWYGSRGSLGWNSAGAGLINSGSNICEAGFYRHIFMRRRLEFRGPMRRLNCVLESFSAWKNDKLALFNF